ncbi:MAG: TlpA disulfide reductase family protein [Planctomycetota bacterium]
MTNTRSLGALILVSILAVTLAPVSALAQATVAGVAYVTTPGGDARTRISLFTPDPFFAGDELEGLAYFGVIDDPESRAPVPWTQKDGDVTIRFEHFGSEINATWVDPGKVLSGTWTKDRGEQGRAVLPFRAVFDDQDEIYESPPIKYLTAVRNWMVIMGDSDDPVLLEIKGNADARLLATVISETGDYRYLRGVATGPTEFELSTFDGSHAFFIKGQVGQDPGAPRGSLPSDVRGNFYSGNWYRTSFEGVPTERFRRTPPDRRVRATDVSLSDLQYPDLDGDIRTLDDPELRGDVTILQVFGSWCPNCGDGTRLLEEMQAVYGGQGLKIIGLAFEVATDPEEAARRVRAHQARYNADWPVLLAGPADKQRAAEAFPLISSVAAYPTFLFVNHEGEVEKVFSGFDGPATGNRYEWWERTFHSQIKEMLRNAESASDSAEQASDGS